MVQLICPICGSPFQRNPSELRSTNYCSYKCSGTAGVRAGHLPPAPKGVRRSPATEFSRGRIPPTRAEVGTVTIRTRHGRRGDTRAWIKVAQPNVWRPRAQVVWEQHHGPIPRGYLIHHDNEDTLDDDISNLRLVTRAEHARIHSDSLRRESQPASAGRNLTE